MGFDLPAVPTITKYELTSLSVGLMAWLKIRAERQALGFPTAAGTRQRTATWGRKSRARVILGILLVLLIIAPMLTVFNNADPIIAGPTFIPGLRPYDALSTIGAALINILPFLLGLWLLKTPESHVTILKVMCIALMAYSLLALWEVRMSPQLNRMLYGFTTSSFLQHMRAGGFRPLVFMDHGLSLGILLSMTILATGALWRHLKAGVGKSGPWLFCLCWLIMTLVLAKSVGALVIALALLPFILLTGVRAQLLLCAILAVVVLLYPMLRGAGYIPTEEIHAFSLERSAERAQSLQFRFDHEDSLLAKANEKPLLGWGSWGRNGIFDKITGEALSVTDGVWIIIIGTSGWLGYIANFGLLTVPILLLALRRRTLDISLATAGLAVVLTANLVDLLPNSALRPLTWLIAGALAGRYIHASEALRQPHVGKAVEVSDPKDVSEPPSPQASIRRPRTLNKQPAQASKTDPNEDPPPRKRRRCV
ncbi:O-antigen ligase [Roseovarius sp. M141]|uniref:O-antigen ligase family protein n=1 Tax=Roseovarius sp. M141 TaxID=2583806 RepID=UPI0020CD631B|nr:O-antigen ligase family protein [Roseovarius sp. M141]MCQ0090474.1 O-antigen ligase family protein [Roseovarius sp. M141]